MKKSLSLRIKFLLGFVIFTVVCIIYGLVCAGDYCGLWGAIPSLPWLFVFGPLDFVNQSTSNSQLSTLWWLGGMLINATLFLLLGFLIEKIIAHFRR